MSTIAGFYPTIGFPSLRLKTRGLNKNMKINENGLLFCEACQISIMPAHWLQHINGKNHKLALLEISDNQIKSKLWERWHSGAIIPTEVKK